MSRENAQTKARRYVVEGRLVVVDVTGSVVTATCRGDGQSYDVTHHPGRGWRCTCCSTRSMRAFARRWSRRRRTGTESLPRKEPMSNEFDRLFDSPGAGLPGVPFCECPDAGALVMAEINGEPRPLCPSHDVGEIRARKVAAEKADAEADLARAYEIHEGVKARQAATHAAKVRAEHELAEEAALAKLDPLVADLHRLTGARIVPIDTPIGDDDAFTEGLARLVGAPGDPARWGTPNIPIGDDAAFGAVLEGIFGAGTFNNEPSHYDDAA